MARRKTSKKGGATTKRRTIRRRRSSGGMLSELFNPVQAQATAKTLISGAVGGVAAGLIGKILPGTTTPQMKSAYTIAAGFITSAVLKMPNVGAGMAAVGARDLLAAQGMLAEDSEFSYANDLEPLPMVLNEDQAQYLAENGMYLAENGMYLAEDDDYQVPYAPEFGGF